MKLPTELLANIARCLPRAYLDGMLILPPQLANGVRAASEPRDKKDAPRRRTLLQVYRCENGSLVVRLAGYARDADPSGDTSNFTGPHVDCYNAEQLRVAVQNRWISDLWFDDMDADLHNVLMQIAPRWRGPATTLHSHPTLYKDKDALFRFFEELIDGVGVITLNFIDGLLLESSSAAGLTLSPRQFWHLPAIRQCGTLRVDKLPSGSPRLGFTTKQALRWAHTPTRNAAAFKQLEIPEEELVEPVDLFIDEFQRDFLLLADHDVSPTVSFKITIFLADVFTLERSLATEDGSDVLRFYNQPDDASVFIIHRYSV